MHVSFSIKHFTTMTLSRFERMVALSEEEYNHLKSLQQTSDPLENKLQSLSSEYKTQGFVHDPYTRVQLQGETLTEMKKVKEDISKRLISLTPKPYQTRAQSLYNFIENKMSINGKGEVLKSDGTIIDGSNIADLIQHAVRDRRRSMIPVGWNHFLNILKDSNTPRMIMNYETLEELANPENRAFKLPEPEITRPTSTRKVIIKHKYPKETTKKRKVSSPRMKKEPMYLKDYLVSDTKKRKYF
jgi:hypothetical protein